MVASICSGKVVIHALDEKAREYYNLEGLWTTDTSEKEPTQVQLMFQPMISEMPFFFFISLFCVVLPTHTFSDHGEENLKFPGK